jgi:N-acetylmuramoyl-L-alanine amidase
MPATPNPPIPGQTRDVRLIVLHCAATPNDRTLFTGKVGTPGFRTPIQEIDAWHKERGFQRDTYWRGRQNASLEAVGYHFVIARNGAIFSGRHVHEQGAHAQGWNRNSIGICLVGTDQYTEVQWLALESCVRGLSQSFQVPLLTPKLGTSNGSGLVVSGGVIGHGKLPGHNKICPGFDVHAWVSGGLKPLAGHVSAGAA